MSRSVAAPIPGEPNATATDRITFLASTNGNPVILGGTEITISSNLTIAGNGATRTQVSGDAASRVLT